MIISKIDASSPFLISNYQSAFCNFSSVSGSFKLNRKTRLKLQFGLLSQKIINWAINGTVECRDQPEISRASQPLGLVSA